MSILAYFLLILSASQSIRAELSVKDYVYWKKADISAWHQYFPSRSLQQENLTIVTAIDTISTMVEGMKSSLSATVRYQQQELETAQVNMEGTSAQGCVNGISSYMDNAIDNSVATFQDCVADVTPYLRRLQSHWARTNAKYNKDYQKTLKAMEYCAQTYPNKDSEKRLKLCVKVLENDYFTSSSSITNDMYASRVMQIFTRTVVSCAQTAASEVVTEGWKFLDKLGYCAKLSENIEAEMYQRNLTSEFNKFITSNDLTTQIEKASLKNSLLVSRIEEQMLHYYNLKKRALEKYVIESRNQSFYYDQMTQNLRKYLNTLEAASLDYPGSEECFSQAQNDLKNVLTSGARKALQCDAQIVNDTQSRLARVNKYFSQINNILPNTGNPAILSCFEEGYIFAEQTILNCYSLAHNEFKINITELNATIVDDVRVLLGYEQSFFSNSSLPCGDPILSRAFLEADRTLYNLQRCLYISSGTKYAVTTPAPFTTTTTTNPPPTWWWTYPPTTIVGTAKTYYYEYDYVNEEGE